jgi:acetyl-CoA carboxylase biotin carboxyl carrier protein
MKLGEIRELIRLLESSGVEEIEVSSWGRRIRVSKSGNSYYHGPVQAPPSPDTDVVSREPAPAHVVPQTQAEKSGKQLKEIKSPMVGTFYRAPAPGAEPFAEIDSDVEVGQTVCIIEAMKLMNEIQSDVKGRIARVLVDNAQPVEYGQTLFMVEPH